MFSRKTGSVIALTMAILAVYLVSFFLLFDVSELPMADSKSNYFYTPTGKTEVFPTRNEITTYRYPSVVPSREAVYHVIGNRGYEVLKWMYLPCLFIWNEMNKQSDVGILLLPININKEPSLLHTNDENLTR